ncbi:hypothetical protein HPB49_017219 [Dermacentor silvarum]|uniref:Uncharacterized protein n=1 Tax=Dermacentor silvarum TaxID=543639 RepID=A0ACB8CG55_DERSI|nr:hypothetical protein HPB49_017219 [Dermacentor silvarum]
MSVRVVKQRRPHVKLTGRDPNVPALNLIAQNNAHNAGVNLYPSLSVGVSLCGGRLLQWLEDRHIPTCTFCATYGHPRWACPVREQPDRAICTRLCGRHLGEQCTVRMGDATVCCTECRRAERLSSHSTGDRRSPDYRRELTMDNTALTASVTWRGGFLALVVAAARKSIASTGGPVIARPGLTGLVHSRAVSALGAWSLLAANADEVTLDNSRFTSSGSLLIAMANAHQIKFLQANLASTREATKILVQHKTVGYFTFALIADPYTRDHKIPNAPCSFIAFHALEHPCVAMLGRAPSFGLFPLFILDGDFNAKHALWGSETGDLRDAQLVQFANANDLHKLNHSSSIPTFQAPYARGYRWLVSEEETLSGHRCIEFARFSATRMPERRLTNFARAQILETVRGHCWFDSICRCSYPSVLMLDAALEHFYSIYAALCKKNLRKVNSRSRGGSWWTPQLAEERLRVRAMHRRYQLVRDPAMRALFRGQCASASAAYTLNIRLAKDAADRALCLDLTARNLFGEPFKFAFAKLHSATHLPPLATSPTTFTNWVLESASFLSREHVAVDYPTADSEYHKRIGLSRQHPTTVPMPRKLVSSFTLLSPGPPGIASGERGGGFGTPDERPSSGIPY